MVLQFFGFVAAWDQASTYPWVYATAAAAMTTWITFVPCFLWIFLLSPYVGKIGQINLLQQALKVMTAASVGVILTLGLWLARHALIPDASRVDWMALLIGLVCFQILRQTKIGMVPLLIAGAVIGALRFL